jgi:hypothetical protein
VLTGILVCASLFYLFHRYAGHGDSANVKPPTKCYYCDEDGTHVFIDDATNVPPFDHNGKIAVRAVIFKCIDSRGTVTKPPFVQRIERYTGKAKTKIEERLKENANMAIVVQHQFDVIPKEPGEGLQVKKPGDKEWVTINNLEEWGKVMNQQFPEGVLRPVSVDEDVHPQ